MIENADRYNNLFTAAETIYKYMEKGKGFYSGSVIGPTGRKIYQYNDYSGARFHLERKLERKLTKDEQTMLALAVGYGPTPSLFPKEREEAFEILWDNQPNSSRACILFDKLVTSI